MSKHGVRFGLLLLLLCVLLGISLGASLWPPRNANITLDPSRRHQTMAGWEVTARLWEFDKANDRYDSTWTRHTEHLFDRLVDELGIDRVRIELRSGVENPVDHWKRFVAGEIGYHEVRRHFYEKVNDNDDPALTAPGGFRFGSLDHQIENVLLPLRDRLEANGERLHVNLCYVDFKWTELGGTLEHSRDPAEYAELISAAFDHMRDKYAVTPDSLEIVLEPDNSRSWNGRRIGEAMIAVLPRLHAAGFSPELIAPSTASMAAAPRFFDDMLAIDGVSELQPTFSYHRYGSRGKSALAAIRERAVAHRLATAMLEHVGGESDELHADLKHGNASAWQQYAIATTTTAKGDSGGYYYVVDPTQEGDAAITMGRRTVALSQYFRFVRIGAVRIHAETDDSSLDPVAFVNPDGTHVVVVRASRSGSLEVHQLPAGKYGVRTSTRDGDIADHPEIEITAGDPLAFELGDRGVVTIHQLGRQPAGKSAP